MWNEQWGSDSLQALLKRPAPGPPAMTAWRLHRSAPAADQQASRTRLGGTVCAPLVRRVAVAARLLVACSLLGRPAAALTPQTLDNVTVAIHEVARTHTYDGAGRNAPERLEVTLDISARPASRLHNLQVDQDDFKVTDTAGHQHPSVLVTGGTNLENLSTARYRVYFEPFSPGQFRLSAELPFQTDAATHVFRFARADLRPGRRVTQDGLSLTLDSVRPDTCVGSPKPPFEAAGDKVDSREIVAGAAVQNGRPCFAVRWESEDLAELFDILGPMSARLTDDHGGKHAAQRLYLWHCRAPAGSEERASGPLVGLLVFPPLPSGARPSALNVTLAVNTASRSLKFQFTGLVVPRG